MTIVFRRTGLSTENIARFAFLFLREIGCGTAPHNAVQCALAESGIEPRPSRECGQHMITQRQRGKWLADQLLARLSEDKAVHASVCAVSLAVLNEFTISPPADHPTEGQLRTYIVCCSELPDQHLRDHEVYAALHAHLAACGMCDERLSRLEQRGGL